jgi:hypothetical protein
MTEAFNLQAILASIPDRKTLVSMLSRNAREAELIRSLLRISEHLPRPGDRHGREQGAGRGE